MNIGTSAEVCMAMGTDGYRRVHEHVYGHVRKQGTCSMRSRMLLFMHMVVATEVRDRTVYEPAV